MATTYLQLVNKVLRALREQQVTASTLLTSSYALLVGQYVNEAKEEVEASWDWKCLRTNITFPTVVGQTDYLLAGTDENSRLLYRKADGAPQVFNLTEEGYRLSEVSLECIRETIAGVSPNAKPAEFAVIRATGGITLRLYPAPNAVFSLQATCVIPQAELTAAATVLTVPSASVYQLAIADATAERGVGLGDRPERLAMKARARLAEDIVQDMEPGELTAYPW